MALPNYKDFALPFGRSTNPQFGAAAVDAYGNMIGSLGMAASQEAAARANADADMYGSWTQGISNPYGMYSGAQSQLYGGLSNLLANNAGAQQGAFNSLGAGLSSLGQGRAQAATGKDNALSGLGIGLGASTADLFGSMGDSMAGVAQAQANESVGLANAMAGIQAGKANSLSNAYGAYSAGLGNVAQSLSAQEAARYNSNAMAEAARQAAIGNIGSSSLGAYGSAAGQALGSWGQAESAYQNAMSNIGAANQASLGSVGAAEQAAIANVGGANQAAVANLGQSRNSALANLANAYSSAGSGLAAAALAGDMDLSFTDYGSAGVPGGGGFSASGTSGPIASGSIDGGGVPGYGGMSLTASRRSDNSALGGVVDRTFGGLSSLQDSIDNQDQAYANLGNSLGASYGAAADASGRAYSALADGLENAQPTRPDYGFLTSTLGDTLNGLRGLAAAGYGNASAGMDQFYNNQDTRNDYSTILDQLASGYGSAQSGISSIGAGFGRSDFGGYSGAVRDGFESSRGDMRDIGTRAFDSIDTNQLSDSDLAAAMYGGFGRTMSGIDGGAAIGAAGYRDSGDAIRNELAVTQGLIGPRPSTSGSDSVSASLLSGLLNAQSRQDDAGPYVNALMGDYSRLIGGGGVDRFMPNSGQYDVDAARRKSFLERELRKAQPYWVANG